MRVLEWIIGVPYFAALIETLRHPERPATKWCHAPKTCRLKHRLVLIKPPHKPARFGLKHVDYVED